LGTFQRKLWHKRIKLLCLAGVISVTHRINLLLVTFALAVIPLSELRAQEEVSRKRVIGGHPTDIKKHPWQAALNIKIGLATHFCSGSFIAPGWVLTAAHCFSEGLVHPEGVKLKTAVTDRLQGNWVVAKKVIVNKSYNSDSHEDDIALIKVVGMPAGAKTIPLLDPSVTLAPGQDLEVTGWGATESGTSSRELREATVPYVDNATCNEPNSYNGRALPGMICAGKREGGIDSCQGDSGGPLVWNSKDGPVLVGVVSWGDGCARELKYGLYTRVTAYREWINHVIRLGSQ
jgi:trypsin